MSNALQTTPQAYQPMLTVPVSLPDGSELVLRVMPLPADVNGNGDIFGGWLMAQTWPARCCRLASPKAALPRWR